MARQPPRPPPTAPPFPSPTLYRSSSVGQTRVSLAKAILNAPRLLRLDEPTASIDPASARDLRQLIREIAAGGDCGILWTSHNMYEVEAVCDREIGRAHV